jgi:ABC-type multidrug transport system fused ATPase/permease subunit
MPEEYLITTVETCLRIFDQKRQKNKFFAFGLKLTIALLSAAITVVLGLSFPGKVESTYKNVALILSALSAVMATWDAFFNHRTLWIRYTIAANRLRSLLQEIKYHCAKHQGTLADDISSDLFKRFQEIVAAANIAWEDMRMHEPGEHTQTGGQPSNHK